MSGNRKLMWILVALLAGVWGAIGYQVVVALNSSDEEKEADTRTLALKDHTKALFRYVDDVRDPFRYAVPANPRKQPKPSVPTQPVARSLPPYRLTGILVNQTTRTAMLEGSDGNVYFLQRGGTIGNLTILDVEQKVVSYEYQKTKGEWNLQ